MNTILSEVTTTIRAQQDASFAYVVPIDLPSIFRGYGPLPAVIATEDQTGGWDAVGQTRTVRFSDGGKAKEELTDYDAPHYFAYRISGFTGPLNRLVTGARGEWWFGPATAGATSVRWRYAFEPRSTLARLLLRFAVQPLWQRYMRSALQAAREQVEQTSAASP